MSKNSTFKNLVQQHNQADDRLELVEYYFKENPEALMDTLGLELVNQNTYTCVNCDSGRGSKATGMFPHFNNDGYKRYHCFACDYSFRPVEGTMSFFPGMSFSEALNFILDIYEPGRSSFSWRTPQRPRALMPARTMQKPTSSLAVDDTLIATYKESVRFREACPEWQQKVADALHLPFSALSRPDIGKAFVGADGLNPDAGDLVTYNLLQGKPQALKVRHTPGIGRPDLVAVLDYSTHQFRFTYNPGDKRTFRMAGNSGELCFGHDSITDATSTVIITEGQSDVLAVCAAAAECGRQDIAVIGRDSATHLLKPVDLDALAGKTVVYCEDGDDAGQRMSVRNLLVIKEHAAKVTTWCARHMQQKDARSAYIKHGARALINSIFYIY